MYIRQIFLIQMKNCLQSMYNHMVGRTVLVISPSIPYSLGMPDSQRYSLSDQNAYC